MSKEKTWFKPDDSYNNKLTDWVYCGERLPVKNGWYDVKLYSGPESRTAWMRAFTEPGPLIGVLSSIFERPFVERRWFDASNRKWSQSCFVGDPICPQSKYLSLYKSHHEWRGLMFWRGLIDKPIYPPDYYN